MGSVGHFALGASMVALSVPLLLLGCGRIDFAALDGAAGPTDAGAGRSDGTADRRDGSPDPGMELAACVDTVDVPGEVTTGETTVYVDAESGVDHVTACVDDASPCRSIQYAIDQYVSGSDGDVVLARGGVVYREQVRLTSAASGSPGSPTVITAWPGTGMPVVDGSGAGREHTISFCCDDTAASHVVVADLSITGAINSGVDINGSGADDNAIVRCRIYGNGEGPSTFSTDAGVTMINGADRNLIAYNEIFDNRDSTADTAIGIRLVDGRGNLAIGNTVRNNQDDGIRWSGISGTITANRVSGNGGYGINLLTGDSIVLCHNRVFDNGLGGMWLNNAVDNRVLHQTIVGNTGPGITLWNDSPDNVVKNTIFAFNGACGLEEHSSGRPAEPTDSHNLYFANTGGPRCDVDADDPGSDLEGADPSFVDRDGRNLDLGPSSPAIGRGEAGTTIGSLR